jgi:hypothetical protein
MHHEVTIDELNDDPLAERTWALRMMIDGFNSIIDCPEGWDYDRLKKLLAEVIKTNR